MYIFFCALFTLCLFCFVATFLWREYIISKVRCMDFCEKFCLINKLAKPFGFAYLSEPDIITSRLDAWQKNFGYHALYDKTATHFNMVFDCEPVYFDYDGCTWMIEFWKGQYGINIGAEIGIYKADTLISPEQYDRTLFHGVSEDEILPISMELNFKGTTLFSIERCHWWLTGFRVGKYCEPENLSLNVSITFSDEEMLENFTESMKRLGYDKCELRICERTLAFCFSTPYSAQPRFLHPWSVRFSRWQNRILCRLYNFVTRPFTDTMDRLLYLYYLLPPIFRHILLFKRNRKQKFDRKCTRKTSRKPVRRINEKSVRKPHKKSRRCK